MFPNITKKGETLPCIQQKRECVVRINSMIIQVKLIIQFAEGARKSDGVFTFLVKRK